MGLELARHLIEQYGYLAVFLSTAVEGEAVVLAAALLGTQGLMQAHWVIAAAAAGAYAGHVILFAIGRWKGMQLIESVPHLRRHYPKANMVMDRYAGWSVFVFQYLYGTRLISAILFGCSTIALPRFLLLQVINCIIWAATAYFAGQLIGGLAVELYQMVGIYGLLLAVLLFAVAALLLYRRFGHRHVQGMLDEGREAGPAQLEAGEGRSFALQQLSYHTGLAARSGKPLSLLLLRLPKGGEERLSLLAHELCRLLRLSDIPARFDADTFAVIAPNTDVNGAQQAVARLLAELRAGRHGEAGIGDLLAGLAQWRPGTGAGRLLDAAFNDLQRDARGCLALAGGQGFDVEAEAQ